MKKFLLGEINENFCWCSRDVRECLTVRNDIVSDGKWRNLRMIQSNGVSLVLLLLHVHREIFHFSSVASVCHKAAD